MWSRRSQIDAYQLHLLQLWQHELVILIAPYGLQLHHPCPTRVTPTDRDDFGNNLTAFATFGRVIGTVCRTASCQRFEYLRNRVNRLCAKTLDPCAHIINACAASRPEAALSA
jgi:hypothetical protein